MLKDWVTETKEQPAASKPLDEPGEVGERPGEPVDLVDDDHADATGLDLGQQPVQRRTLQRAAGHTAIVEAVLGEDPAFLASGWRCKPAQASYWASSELNPWSRPSSEDLRV